MAQPLDRFGEIVALGDEAAVLRLDLAQLFLGAQVDRAEPLALAPQLLQPLLDVRDIGQFRARRDLGKRRDVLRLGFEHLADFVRDVGGAALRGLEPLLRARLLVARSPAASSAARAALSASASAVSAAARRSAAARCAGFGGLDLGDQRAALLGERRGRAFERGALGLCVRRCARRASRSGRPRSPCGSSHSARSAAIAASRRVAQLGFARERLRFAARFGERRALAPHLAARLREMLLQIGGRAELLDRLHGFVLGRDRLVAARR